MIALFALLAAIFAGPDPAPALDAVKSCNRAAMAGLVKAEPHRRADFAAAAYSEQQAIARERATLLAAGSAPANAAALAQLDARQRQLDDARAVELSWRTLLDEARADFLVNCAGGKAAAGGNA